MCEDVVARFRCSPTHEERGEDPLRFKHHVQCLPVVAPEALLVPLHNGSAYIFFRRMRTIRTVRSAEAKRLQKLLDARAVEKQLDGMARDLNSNP